MAAFNLTETGVNPWDITDCEACAAREEWPCDFHQGVAHGEYLTRLQIEAALDYDEFLPAARRKIVDYAGLTVTPSAKYDINF